MIKTVILSFFFSIWTIGGAAQYVDITEESGVNHAHVSGQLMGGGIVVLDFDKDGFEDLFMTGGEGRDRLYLNLRDNTYKDISDILPQNNNKTEITTGAISADFNGDGCIDLFITSFNREENCILLQNDCNGGFREVTNRAGIVETSSSMGATVLDFDLDGDLDIYVINYIEKSMLLTNEAGETIGFDHECADNFLYVNEGDMEFRESAEVLGAQGAGCGLAVTSVNFIEGKPAIYIANDFGEWIQPNELLVYDNELNIFEDKAPMYGLDYGLYGMGIAIGDPDRDNDLDVYISNLGQNAYLVNDGSNHFAENSVARGIDNTWSSDTTLAVSWGVLFLDHNNDGWQDLFVANGWIPSAEFIKSGFIDPCKFYVNEKGAFNDVTGDAGLGFDYVNRGVVYTDMDNDGRMDLVLSGLDATDIPDSEKKFRVLRNDTDDANNFVSVELVGTASNTEGFGSLIDVYTADSITSQLLFPGGTFCSQNSNRVHVGLGQQDIIDSIVITWPNGNQDHISGVQVNQRLEITEGGTVEILGCTDPDDANYNPLATKNSGCFQGNSTSIINVVTANTVDVYPTIFIDQDIHILSTSAWRNTVLRIHNMNGKMVDQREVNLQPGEPYPFSLHPELPSSAYFLHLYSDDKRHFSAKIIKM